ncbi:cupin domain-containing protein [Candidatus Altiarchaeota archaeon]
MDSEGWVQLRQGIWRKPLARDEEKGVQADYIRVEPDFSDHPHFHQGLEWVYIIEGGFTDQAGRHVAGDFLINSMDGEHQVSTGPDGCLLLIFWTGSVKPA